MSLSSLFRSASFCAELADAAGTSRGLPPGLHRRIRGASAAVTCPLDARFKPLRNGVRRGAHDAKNATSRGGHMARDLIKRCKVGRSTIHGWGLFADVPAETQDDGWRRGAVLDETPLEIVGDYGELADYVYSLGGGRFGLPKGDGIF